MPIEENVGRDVVHGAEEVGHKVEAGVEHEVGLEAFLPEKVIETVKEHISETVADALKEHHLSLSEDLTPKLPEIPSLPKVALQQFTLPAFMPKIPSFTPEAAKKYLAALSSVPPEEEGEEGGAWREKYEGYLERQETLLEHYDEIKEEIEDKAKENFTELYELILEADVVKFRNQLIPIYQALVLQHGGQEAALAASFYDEFRDVSGVKAPFKAVPADVAPPESLEQNVVAAVGSMIGEGGGPDAAKSRMIGSMMRQVRNPARDTITENAHAEIKATGRGPVYARMLVGSTNCPWCVMLASRGFVYGSEETAYAGWHDHCDCRVISTYDGRLPKGYNLAAYKGTYRKNQSDPSTAIHHQPSGFRKSPTGGRGGRSYGSGGRRR